MINKDTVDLILNTVRIEDSDIIMRFRLFLSVCLLFVLIVLVPSCSKSKSSWKDYGDYYSFDEGFRFDGEEYHERLMALRNGMMHRNYVLSVSDSVMKIYYASYYLSTKPRGSRDALLAFELTIDSCLFTNGLKWRMIGMSPFRDTSLIINGQPAGVVEFNHNKITSAWDIQGWISFSVGNLVKEFKEQNVRIYDCPECLFEFELTGPDNQVMKISDGYIH